MALAHTSCRGVGVIEQMIHFHFLRPEWLLLAPGLLVFERLLRTSGDNGDRFHDIIDPELCLRELYTLSEVKTEKGE